MSGQFFRSTSTKIQKYNYLVFTKNKLLKHSYSYCEFWFWSSLQWLTYIQVRHYKQNPKYRTSGFVANWQGVQCIWGLIWDISNILPPLYDIDQIDSLKRIIIIITVVIIYKNWGLVTHKYNDYKQINKNKNKNRSLSSQKEIFSLVSSFCYMLFFLLLLLFYIFYVFSI